MGRYEMILYHGYRDLLSLEGLAYCARVHPALVELYVDYDLLEPVQIINGVMFFTVDSVARLKTVQRLRAEIGVSLAGAAVILDLTEKIRRLQFENDRLRQDRP